MQVRNPIYSNSTNTTIDLEIEHPDYGWIPFTASPEDVEQHGRDLYAAAKRGAFGAIAPYVEPEPQPIPIPASVTRRQGRLALLQAGKLEAVEQAVSEAGLAAQINYEAETWDRDNALLVQLWTDLGGTETELDELFILAAGL